MFPGDNFKIGASVNEPDFDGIDEQNAMLNSSAREMLDGRLRLSESLFVWRRLHIEVDSMGAVTFNHISGTIVSGLLSTKRKIQINRNARDGERNESSMLLKLDVPSTFLQEAPRGRFENGRIQINGVGSFKVLENEAKYSFSGEAFLFITVEGKIFDAVNQTFDLYDDDNLSNSAVLKGDEGEDVPDDKFDFSLLQESDDPESNVLAHAYIKPFRLPSNFNQSDIHFDLHTPNFRAPLLPNGTTPPSELNEIQCQILNGLSSVSEEKDDFWIAYIQGAYQSGFNVSNDPSQENAVLGTTPAQSNDTPNTAANGSQGSLIYLETNREISENLKRNGHDIVIPHEIGHQFGLKGDTGGEEFGIMSYNNSNYHFVPIHISKLRSRTRKPGFIEVPCQVQVFNSSLDLLSSKYIGARSGFLEQNNAKLFSSNIQLSSGDLDPTFDIDGKVTTELNSGKNDSAYTLAVQSDGKILVGGDTYNGINTDFGIVRYNTDGSIDSGFGNSGKVIAPIGTGYDFVTSIKVQTDNKIIVAGYSESGGRDADFALVRYLANGAIDTTFGANGKVLTDISGNEDQLAEVLLQTDGKILAAGLTSNGVQSDIALVRYNANGSLDTTFDTDGIVVTSFNSLDQFASDLALQSDGKIIIAGETENGSDTDFFVARYGTDGTLDNTFGTNGKTITDFSTSEDDATSLVIQSDGKIVVGGYTGNLLNPDFALARYSTDGTLDNTFGTNGKVVTDFAGNAEFVNDISIRNSGIIVAVGHSYNNTNSDLAVAEYLPTGLLNIGFGSGGKVMTPIGASDDFGIATVIQPDNKIVVAGASFNGNDDDFAVARYLATAPSAASVTVGGQVLTVNDQAVTNAIVILTDSSGTSRTARTNSFGYFRFDEVQVGETYIVDAKHKRYSFSSQVINVYENISNLIIVANDLFGDISKSSRECFICNLKSSGTVDFDHSNPTAFDQNKGGTGSSMK